MSDLEILMGGVISAFALGWATGRWMKSLRQFFDSL